MVLLGVSPFVSPIEVYALHGSFIKFEISVCILFPFLNILQGSDHIVCSALSGCGTWLAYSDVDKVKLYNVSLSPPSINKVSIGGNEEFCNTPPPSVCVSLIRIAICTSIF